MEAASVGFAVISLTLQLIQTADTARTYIRNYKQATTEALKLADTLETFGDVLKDVDDFIKHQNCQASNHQIPGPSATLDHILKRCKTNLQPLQDMLDGLNTQAQHGLLRDARRRDRVRFSLKARDVGDLERRIQQEMTAMVLALTLNGNRMQLHLSSQQYAVAAAISQHTSSYPPQEYSYSGTLDREYPPTTQNNPPHVHSATTESNSSDLTLRPNNSEPRYLSRTIVVDTPLKLFGIRKRKVVRFQRERRTDCHQPERSRDSVVSEEIIYSWASGFWGTGTEWSSIKMSGLSGTLYRGLQTYPVVQNLYLKSYELLDKGTLEDLTAAFQSGQLHPFMRDAKLGMTLMHYAAQFCRADVCQLLENYGLESTADNSMTFPLQVICFSGNDNGSAAIDTTRELLRLSANEDFASQAYLFRWGRLPSELVFWLWDMASLLEDDRVPGIVRDECIYSICKLTDSFDGWRTFSAFLNRAASSTDMNSRTYLVSENFLMAIFFGGDREIGAESDSFFVGGLWKETLTKLNVDLDDYIAGVLKQPPDFFLKRHINCELPTRKLVIEKTPDQGWRVGWKWWIEPEAPGYDLVSEYTALTIEGLRWSWPYCFSHKAYSPRVKRGKRWKLRKQKKEWKRLGRKSPSATIPGSWIP